MDFTIKRSQASQRAGFSPRVMQEVNEMQVMLGFVAAGLGIALLSACCQTLSPTWSSLS